MLKINVVKDSISISVPSAFTANKDGKNDEFGVAGQQLLSEF